MPDREKKDIREEMTDMQETPDMQPEFTKEERRWAILGALKSTLLIGGAYLIGMAVVILLMLKFWT